MGAQDSRSQLSKSSEEVNADQTTSAVSMKTLPAKHTNQASSVDSAGTKDQPTQTVEALEILPGAHNPLPADLRKSADLANTEAVLRGDVELTRCAKFARDAQTSRQAQHKIDAHDTSDPAVPIDPESAPNQPSDPRAPQPAKSPQSADDAIPCQTVQAPYDTQRPALMPHPTTNDSSTEIAP